MEVKHTTKEVRDIPEAGVGLDLLEVGLGPQRGIVAVIWTGTIEARRRVISMGNGFFGNQNAPGALVFRIEGDGVTPKRRWGIAGLSQVDFDTDSTVASSMQAAQL
jgi:hypothetical protein